MEKSIGLQMITLAKRNFWRYSIIPVFISVFISVIALIFSILSFFQP